MPRIDDFMNKKEPAPRKPNDENVIYGGFICQICDVSVGEAIMGEDRSITWRCPDGHLSQGRL